MLLNFHAIKYKRFHASTGNLLEIIDLFLKTRSVLQTLNDRKYTKANCGRVEVSHEKLDILLGTH